MSREEELTFLVRSVMRGGRPMTARKIVRELRRRARITTNTQCVIKVLRADQRHFVMRRPRFFQRSTRWQFIEAGPARDSGESGAPVPAWPLRPLLSGAAAVKLEFRRDEPPTNAVGRMT